MFNQVCMFINLLKIFPPVCLFGTDFYSGPQSTQGRQFKIQVGIICPPDRKSKYIDQAYLPIIWLGLLYSHVPICTGGLAVPVSSKRWPRLKDMYTTHEFEINTHFNFPVFRSRTNNLLSEFRQNGVWPAASNIRPSRPASVGLEMHQKPF